MKGERYKSQYRSYLPSLIMFHICFVVSATQLSQICFLKLRNVK